MATRRKKNQAIPFVAAFLAWLVPGAGHVYLGRVTRGSVLFVTVSALFWAGIGVGGVATMDPKNERWWFIGQMLTGVHGLIGWQRQRAMHGAYLEELAQDERFLEEQQQHPYPRRLRQDYLDQYMARDGVALAAPTDTVARAYAGVAGLLNLMCVFDVLMLSLMGKHGEPKPDGGKKRKSGDDSS